MSDNNDTSAMLDSILKDGVFTNVDPEPQPDAWPRLAVHFVCLDPQTDDTGTHIPVTATCDGTCFGFTLPADVSDADRWEAYEAVAIVVRKAEETRLAGLGSEAGKP